MNWQPGSGVRILRANPRYHFSLQAQLRRQLPPGPDRSNPATATRSALTLKAAEFYQQGPSSLFHGPSFQGIQQVLHLSPETLTMQCRVARTEASHQGQFPVQTLNPYIADVEIQSTWLWLQHFHQCGCLPSEIREFHQFEPVPFDTDLWVSMQLKARTQTAVVVDIITHDRQGKIYSRMLEARATVLPPHVEVSQLAATVD